MSETDLGVDHNQLEFIHFGRPKDDHCNSLNLGGNKRQSVYVASILSLMFHPHSVL